MMSLQDTIDWFQDLKSQGVTKEEVLDVLEFDSDYYPDPNILQQAKDIVFGK